MKTFFLEKKLHHIFCNFSNFDFFLIFCQKNSIIRAEKIFSRNHTIWYTFYSKLVIFTDFAKIQVVFSKKPKFWNFWEILFQPQFTANLLKVDEEEVHIQKHRQLNWQTTGKKTHNLSGRFYSHIL